MVRGPRKLYAKVGKVKQERNVTGNNKTPLFGIKPLDRSYQSEEEENQNNYLVIWTSGGRGHLTFQSVNFFLSPFVSV